MLDLSDVTAKILRAYEHLHQLNTEIDAWVATEPYGLWIQDSDDGRRHAATLRIYRNADDPRFGLLVGDCASNLRVVVDYLVAVIASIDSLPPTSPTARKTSRSRSALVRAPGTRRWGGVD